jgi:septal ring factor EnvC (AmiA/AmiB activator)
MMKQAAVAYTQSDTPALQESLKQLNQLQKDYKQTVELLGLKVTNQAQMQSALKQTQMQYQQYSAQIQTLFSAKIEHQQAISDF